MKKLYLSILFIYFIKSSIGQPIFNSGNFPQVGSVTTTYALDPTGLSEGSAGINQTWNFATATPTGTTSTSYIVAPSSTPYASMFPTANRAGKTTTSMGNEGYAFYNAASTFVEVVGAGTHSPTVDIFFDYSNPQRVINYPFTYNSTIQDNYVGFATYVVGGFTVNDYRTGSISILADAYGSITTPDKNYPSSLRIKQSEATVDSIVIPGFSTSMSYVNHTTYSWSAANSFNTVFYLSYDTVDQGTGLQISVSAAYGSDVTGINENYTPYALSIFPNPASRSSRVNITSDELDAGSTTFYAIDMTGRVAKEIDFMLYPANHKKVSIDMSDCNSGLYYIRLVQKEKSFTSKFLLN